MSITSLLHADLSPDSNCIQLPYEYEEPKQPKDSSDLEESSEAAALIDKQIEEDKNHAYDNDDYIGDVPEVFKIEKTVGVYVKTDFENERAKDDKFGNEHVVLNSIIEVLPVYTELDEDKSRVKNYHQDYSQIVSSTTEYQSNSSSQSYYLTRAMLSMKKFTFILSLERPSSDNFSTV